MKNVVSIAVFVTLIVALLSAGTAYAADRVCRGTLGAVTVDNLHVPQDAVCRLEGTRVRGNITVARNARLFADGVIVDGDIQAAHARRVDVIRRSSVGGNIQIEDSRVVRVINARIDGDLQVEDNTRRVVTNRNSIGGNLQAFQNRATLIIRRNRIDGNLQCKGNQPALTGGGNIVQGSKEDQCARL